MMFQVFLCFVLAVSTGVATKLHTVADVPPIDPTTGLPYGYAKKDIIWSGFESILGDSDPVASSGGRVFTDLVINGTVQHVMAQVEGMGFTIKPLDNVAFDAKMTAIEARGGETEPPTDVGRATEPAPAESAAAAPSNASILLKELDTSQLWETA
ncbi:hypothetical protein DL765_008530 [Monosporascus sp. GIB2]|nr:hypothetical protein DL765_008530 [Monosporascus sp. GIB2]